MQLEITHQFSNEDKLLIKEVVTEVIQEAIHDFGVAQKRNISFHGPEEVCQILSVHKNTLNSWRKKGIVTGFKVGGKYLYSQDEIEKVAELGLKYRR